MPRALEALNLCELLLFPPIGLLLTGRLCVKASCSLSRFHNNAGHILRSPELGKLRFTVGRWLTLVPAASRWWRLDSCQAVNSRVFFTPLWGYLPLTSSSFSKEPPLAPSQLPILISQGHFHINLGFLCYLCSATLPMLYHRVDSSELVSRWLWP